MASLRCSALTWLAVHSVALSVTALVAAGCEYAVHLDMSGSNTGFELFRVSPPAQHPPLEHALVGGFDFNKNFMRSLPE